METNTKRLHPLLTAAAVSLTVFSAVGVAAIAGLIPHSKGQAQDATPVAAVQAPLVKPEPVPAPQAAPKPARKPAVHHKPAAKPAARVATTETPAPIAQAPQAAEPPKPVQQPGLHGVVESVREVEVKGDAKGIGAAGGGVA